MDVLASWQVLWFVLILIMFLIYTMLDGFDLGIGMLLPFFKKEADAGKLISFISPFWDGNEVWMIIALGSLFAVSPQAFTTILSGFYLPMTFAIFCFIFRGISLEFGYHTQNRKNFWARVFTAGSFLATLLGMLALGNLLVGIPLTPRQEYVGGLQALFRPFPLLFCVTGIAVVMLQGAAYAVLKSTGDLNTRAVQLARRLFLICLACFLVFTLVTLAVRPAASQRAAIWLGAALVFASLAWGLRMVQTSPDQRVFLCSSSAIAGFWMMIGGLLFPNLIPASNDAALNLTIYNASAALPTLRLLAGIAIPVMFVIGGYTLFVYSVFREKTQNQSRRNGMKEYMVCKACGFVMEKTKLPDKCPACGVPAKMFEPSTERLSDKRRFLLALDLHPVMVHFPQAFTGSILALAILSLFVAGTLQQHLFSTILVLSFCLPFTVVLAFISGLFDGQVRFRKVTTPLLQKKILLGLAFFFLSVAILAATQLYPLADQTVLFSLILLTAGCLVCGTILALYGVSLLNTKFPG